MYACFSDKEWRTMAATTLVAVVAMSLLAVVRLGLPTGGRLSLGLVVALCVPLTLYRSRTWSSVTGAYLLLALWVLLATLSVNNIYEWLSPAGATPDMPALYGDDRSYYRWALHYYDGRVDVPHVAFPGLPVMILLSWKLLGVNVVWPVTMNVTFTLTAIVITSITAVRLLGKREIAPSETTIGTLTLLGCALLTFMLSHGAAVLKEAAVTLSMSVVGAVLAVFVDNRHLEARHYMAFAIACVMLAFIRTTYMYLVMLALIVVALGNVKSRVPHVALLLAITVATFVVGDSVAYYSFERHALIISGGERMQSLFIVGESQQPYLNLIGNYFHYPIWKRLVLLPLTTAVQYIIPFPWSYGRTLLFGEILARCSYGWYMVGGLAMFYYLFLSWRERYSLGAWAWVAPTLFAAVAYISAGSVSRYVVPIQAMFVPVALWALCVARADSKVKRLMLWWAVVYAVVMVVTLVTCYQIQVNYLRSLNEYYRSLRELQSN